MANGGRESPALGRESPVASRESRVASCESRAVSGVRFCRVREVGVDAEFERGFLVCSDEAVEKSVCSAGVPRAVVVAGGRVPGMAW